MAAPLNEIAETLHRLTGQSLALCEVSAQLLIDAEKTTSEAERLRYERGVQRAVSMVPMLCLVREDADYHLNAATGAAVYEGVSGTLVLGVQRKSNQPTEINWLGGKVELKVVV